MFEGSSKNKIMRLLWASIIKTSNMKQLWIEFIITVTRSINRRCRNATFDVATTMLFESRCCSVDVSNISGRPQTFGDSRCSWPRCWDHVGSVDIFWRPRTKRLFNSNASVSIHSPPHIHASPPTTNFFWASVPVAYRSRYFSDQLSRCKGNLTGKIVWITSIIVHPIFAIGNVIKIPKNRFFALHCHLLVDIHTSRSTAELDSPT